MAQEPAESVLVYRQPTVVGELGSRLDYFGIQPGLHIEVVTTYPIAAALIHRDKTAAHRQEPERRVTGRRAIAADTVRPDMPDDFVGTGAVALLLDVLGMWEYLSWY